MALYGRKRMLQITIAIFLAGSLLCAASQAAWQLILFRALQGIGAGGLLGVPLGIIADVIPAQARGRYQGWYASTFALASITGPLIGGFLVDHAGWRWVFLVNVPVGATALAITGRLLPHLAAAGKSAIDAMACLLAGLALLGCGVGLSMPVLVMNIQTGSRPATSAWRQQRPHSPARWGRDRHRGIRGAAHRQARELPPGLRAGLHRQGGGSRTIERRP